MPRNKYYFPFGYEGIGKDVGWCERWSGGKFCMLCRHHAKFKEWTKNWHWYYLIQWYDENWTYPGYEIRANWKHYWRWSWYKKTIQALTIEPARYRSTGLSEAEFKSLLKKGCKPQRKCKCTSLSQRGNWYCPNCYRLLEIISQHRNCHIHDLMIQERDTLKEEVLILKLSGAF